MKLSHYIAASFILSLIAHILLMMFLSGVKIVSPVPVTPAKRHKPFSITLLPPPVISPKKLEPQEKTLATQTLEESGRRIKEILQNEQLSTKQPDAIARFAGIEHAAISPKLPAAPEMKPGTAPRPKIVEIDATNLTDERRGKRVIDAKANREDASILQLPSLMPEGPLTEGVGPTYDVGLRLAKPQFALPGELEDDETAGGGIAGSDTAKKLQDEADNLVQEQTKTVPFDQFVNATIQVKDAEDGGYFKLQISANEKSGSVREINKDIMLIIDQSYSIPRKKFKAFQEAAKISLDYLNPQDNFNIVSFANKAIPFSTTYLPATEGNRKRGREFISRLDRGGMTNLFDGLYPFVKNTASQNNRPLNIFLLTDGVATVNIYKDDDFIQKITNINPGHVSIFPFCAGDEINQELLDFLGFLNRGYCCHSNEIPDISEKLTTFITEHCNLLIRDLEYTAEKNIADTIYPRKLQHLYRGGSVTLYGKYLQSDKELIITLRGRDYANTKRDIILKFNLMNSRRTEEPIDKQWAATKILHLVADRTLTKDAAEKAKYTNEIKRLALKFNLAVPY